MKYTLELISNFGLAGAKSVGAPIEINQKITYTEICKHFGLIVDKPLDHPGTYQRLLGRLFYLTITRPDIEFVVQCIS